MKLFAKIFLPIGLFLLAVSAWIYQHQKNFYATALHSNGRVVELIQVRGGKGNRTFTPKFEFTDTAGRSFTFKSKISSNPPDYRVGQSVLIAYAPNDPSHAEVDSFAARWMLPLIFGGLGLVFTIIGSGFAIAERRSQERVYMP